MTIKLIKSFFLAKTESYLLYQDVSHGLDVFVSIIWRKSSLLTGRVWIVRAPSCAKFDLWVARATLILALANNTNSGLRMSAPATNDIKTLLWCSCTVMSRRNQSTLSTSHNPVRWRGIAHQRSVSTERQLASGWQWIWAVDLHTETDLEGCVPVGG